jgi:hypothetical protein
MLSKKNFSRSVTSGLPSRDAAAHAAWRPPRRRFKLELHSLPACHWKPRCLGFKFAGRACPMRPILRPPLFPRAPPRVSAGRRPQQQGNVAGGQRSGSASRLPSLCSEGSASTTSSVLYLKISFLNPNYTRHSCRTTTTFWPQFKRDLAPIRCTTCGGQPTGSPRDAGAFRPRCHFPQNCANADRKPARRLQ